MEDEHKPKYKELVIGLNDLTLGISMVIAVLIGVGLGYALRWIFGVGWVLWIGVFFGVAAAVLNVFKAYKQQQKAFAELANDPKYSHKKSVDKSND